MFATKVRVQNFRSLVDTEVVLDGYTALVGLNDSGKSNLLRALNLFFNGHTDPNQPLVFDKDFSQKGKVIGKKARQIEVALEFSPPSNYSDSSPVVWKKTYRAGSSLPYSDELRRVDGKEFVKNSRTAYWVRQIAFEYVPAIRGDAFFKILKRRLYATLASTVAPKLTSASGSFLSSLRAEVKGIESESKRLLDLTTEFSLPGDLGQLFEVLDFDAADPHARTALQYRGDGIQGRHISLILKFLADQRNVAAAKGRPSSQTIWGFEEPENNLELAKQVEVAAEFAEYASSIQILVSTHSPAFYGQALSANGVRIACRSEGRTEFASSLVAKSIDEHLGLMPFIQPYLVKAERERDDLIQSLKDLESISLILDKPALYVEGDTDKLILDAVLKAKKATHSFQIVAKPGLGGGVNWVVGYSVARAAMTDLAHKTAALLDDDNEGRRGVQLITARCKAIGRDGKVKTLLLAKNKGPDHIRTLKTAGITLAIGIEELCPLTCWDHASKKGWLEERGTELITDNAGLLTKLSDSVIEVIQSKIHDQGLLQLIKYRVNPLKKSDFARYVVRYFEDGGKVPETLSRLVDDVCAFFS